MADITRLEAAFDTWLRERRDDLTLRQQFWLAWKAGAEWAIEEVRQHALAPVPLPQHSSAGAPRDE